MFQRRIVMLWWCVMSAATVATVHSAKILAVFPTPSYSHQSVYKVYVEALAERGHELTIVQPTTRVRYARSHMHNITIVDCSLEDNYFDKLLQRSTVFRKRGLISDTSTVTALNYMGLVRMIRDQFNTKAVQNLIDSRPDFDLLITEAFMDYPLVFSHLWNNLPVVQISSGHGVPENFETHGAVARHPIYYPNMWRNKFRNLNVWDTIGELYSELRLQNEFSVLLNEENKMLREQFGINTPKLEMLRSNARLLLINVHHVLDNNRPVPPSVQYLGGLHLHNKKPLSKLANEYVQNFLDESTRGVVYVSFGSSVSLANMDNEFLTMLLETFKMLPYDVAWKNDRYVERSRIPDNVCVQAWFDQYTLLHHRNVKAFVTQGGVQSIDEAIEALVPLVGVPLMGDQTFNVNKLVDLGIGSTVDDAATVDSAQMTKIIVDTIANNYDKYRKNLRHLRHAIRHQPMTPLEKAVWYTERAASESDKQLTHTLKTPAANVNYSQYYMSYIIIPFVTVAAMNHLQQLLQTTFFSL
ncbi:Egtecdysteroid UDP-glucosyl transferase [Trabala vishnou gigantina nucleopolyhedrovirus]|uniref:Egtecdysteroid UDP-glucosyl transferase n=1 Tax=Trabala vishnou gigantina nucleopolyhedrovirus TaxID=2863583 RepID=UPI002481C49D|nr:Egtecdysteroid UDP-glucosyl transferase [Trabala vishnou gigantina nucleopolyhedrovirus]QYC92667.1 Egtecdysteroid UDP-glucosyl transferase [Trabala vishnou gigantina nucleopolyhedrovirus]